MADLLSKRRSRSVARPRQVAMALAKELTSHSLPEIGDAFGGRDHTTVLHACKRIKELRDTRAAHDGGLLEPVENSGRMMCAMPVDYLCDETGDKVMHRTCTAVVRQVVLRVVRRENECKSIDLTRQNLLSTAIHRLYCY